MTADLTAIERGKYEKVWADPRYRQFSPGERHMEEAIRSLGMKPGERVIDFGCGTGRAVKQFTDRGFPALGVDFAENCLDDAVRNDVTFIRACLWDLPPDLRAEWGYSTDVMEHIPPQKVGAVLDGIAGCVEKGAFFSIATRKDGFGPLIIGEPLHLTVQPPEWWMERLEERFASVGMAPRDGWATYVCQAA